MPVMIATLERGGTNFDISSPAISPFSLGSTQTMHERWLEHLWKRKRPAHRFSLLRRSAVSWPLDFPVLQRCLVPLPRQRHETPVARLCPILVRDGAETRFLDRSTAGPLRGFLPTFRCRNIGFPAEHKPRYECAFRWRVSAPPGLADSRFSWRYRVLSGAFCR